MASPIVTKLWRSQSPFFPFLLYSSCFDGFGNLALRIFSQTTVQNTIPKIPRSHYFSKPDFEQSFLPKEEKENERETHQKPIFHPQPPIITRTGALQIFFHRSINHRGSAMLSYSSRAYNGRAIPEDSPTRVQGGEGLGGQGASIVPV